MLAPALHRLREVFYVAGRMAALAASPRSRVLVILPVVRRHVRAAEQGDEVLALVLDFAPAAIGLPRPRGGLLRRGLQAPSVAVQEPPTLVRRACPPEGELVVPLADLGVLEDGAPFGPALVGNCSLHRRPRKCNPFMENEAVDRVGFEPTASTMPR